MKRICPVVLDVDGVLADVELAFCEKFGWENRHLSSFQKRYPEHEYEIDLFIESPKTYENLHSIPLGVAIAKWCEENYYDIHVVTSRPETAERITGLWLKRNKIPFHFLSVRNGDKLNVIKQIAPAFVVDDSLESCNNYSELGLYSFLVDSPWNSGDLPRLCRRINNFSEFLKKIEKLPQCFYSLI